MGTDDDTLEQTLEQSFLDLARESCLPSDVVDHDADDVALPNSDTDDEAVAPDQLLSPQLNAYVRVIREQVRKDIKTSKKPRCYKAGLLVIPAIDELLTFDSSRQAKHKISPDTLYQLDVFVWLPLYLPGQPVGGFRCFDCGKLLSSSGKNELIELIPSHTDRNLQDTRIALPLDECANCLTTTILF